MAIELLAGCGGNPERPAPATFPVTGKLVLNNGKTVEHATIEFVPTEGSKALSGLGIADAVGEFSISVPYPDRRLPGLPEGTYRAIVMLPLQPDRSGGERYELKEEFTVLPNENRFSVTVPSLK